jgi:pimeloyl-ACP methyl ester carboxylesterase
VNTAWVACCPAMFELGCAVEVFGAQRPGVPKHYEFAVCTETPGPVMMERELMTLMWAGSHGYRMEPKFPGILTDGELRAIDVPVLLITGARSAMLTPAEARDRARFMPHAEVAIVPGSHGGFNRIDELNDRIAAFIKAQATGKQTAQPARTPATKR